MKLYIDKIIPADKANNEPDMYSVMMVLRNGEHQNTKLLNWENSTIADNFEEYAGRILGFMGILEGVENWDEFKSVLLSVNGGELERKAEEPIIEEYNRWHASFKDPIIGGLWIGQLGAMSHILNEKHGKPLTRGFHSFWMHKGTLMGSLGATDIKVNANGDGWLNLKH